MVLSPVVLGLVGILMFHGLWRSIGWLSKFDLDGDLSRSEVQETSSL